MCYLTIYYLYFILKVITKFLLSYFLRIQHRSHQVGLGNVAACVRRRKGTMVLPLEWDVILEGLPTMTLTAKWGVAAVAQCGVRRILGYGILRGMR
jgi:hypothetical protein